MEYLSAEHFTIRRGDCRRSGGDFNNRGWSRSADDYWGWSNTHRLILFLAFSHWSGKAIMSNIDSTRRSDDKEVTYKRMQKKFLHTLLLSLYEYIYSIFLRSLLLSKHNYFVIAFFRHCA